MQNKDELIDNISLEQESNKDISYNCSSTENNLREHNSTEHISTERLRVFVDTGVLNQSDLEVLEHITVCPTCKEIYVDMVESGLLTMPADLKENILENIICKNTISSSKVKSIEESKKYFYRYCVKVTLACACSLMLLFAIDKALTMDLNQTSKNHNSRFHGLFEGTIDFMDIYKNKMEGYDYENEKK